MSLTAPDRLEIGELVARFAHASDYGDWDALAACFTEDVVTSIAGTPTYVGIAAQVAHAKSSAEWTDRQNRHLALNLWIEPDGPGAARACWYVVNFVAGTNPGEPRLVVSGRMTDHVVRTAVGWRIARRDFRPDQQFTVPDGNADASGG
jgi:ketosteroid isomerase-like protein